MHDQCERFPNKILAIALCPIYLFIALFALFVFGISRVDASSNIFSFSGNAYHFCTGSSCSSASLTYTEIAYTNFYRFQTSSSFNTTNVNMFNLYNVSQYDVSQYDYMLMTVTTGPNFIVSSAKNEDYDQIIGYSLTSNFSTMTDGDSFGLADSSYTTVLKFDLTTANRIGGLFTFYFTGTYVGSGISFLMINYNIYFGKNGDDLSSAINNQTTEITDSIKEQTQAQKEQTEAIKEQTETQKETNDYLKDDTPPDADVSSLGNVTGLLPPGPLDSLLNLPFQFLSIIVSSLGDICTPLEMDFVYDSKLTLPCLSSTIYDNMPSGLMVFVNLIPTTFLLIVYFKHLYKKVERATSLETNSDDEWGCI